jgi:hypothetical protein
MFPPIEQGQRVTSNLTTIHSIISLFFGDNAINVASPADL